MPEAPPQSNAPLVSIGIPTYNRPDLLARAIADARGQTHANLEIIISDNASGDPRVEALCRDAARADPRVRYVRQPTNVGPMPNFEFTLVEARGAYFCWFADDDGHAPDFIARLVATFAEVSRPTVLVGCEAQYETPGGPFPFFVEGARLYSGLAGDACARVAAMTRHAHGNIIYGLFRREAMFHRGIPLTRWIGPSLNELPFFAMVAAAGDVVCLPHVGFTKRAPERVCRAARWEQEGGFHPEGPRLNAPATARYHATVLAELSRAYDALDLSERERRALKADARRSLAVHALALTAGWKPRPRSLSP
jgi:Glycosyl transferase family 2